MLSFTLFLLQFPLPSWVFFILSLLGLRQWLVRVMPQSLVLAVGAGIGLFIASVRIALSFSRDVLTVAI